MKSVPLTCLPPVHMRHVAVAHRVSYHLSPTPIPSAPLNLSGVAAHVGEGGGVAWGLAPGAGQLGAAGLGYYAVGNCWSYELVYDRFGNYLGEQPANICLELRRN
jgi:hypothetical protein